jgi:hypothetical protein
MKTQTSKYLHDDRGGGAGSGIGKADSEDHGSPAKYKKPMTRQSVSILHKKMARFRLVTL